MLTTLDTVYEEVSQRPAAKIAVAAAEDGDIIEIVKESLARHIAKFTLIGDKGRIEALAEEARLDPNDVEIIDEPDHGRSAQKAVRMVKEGGVGLVMKGNLHTAVFLKAVLDKENGIRGGGLITQVSVYDKFFGEGLQLLSDCAINISPDLPAKKAIIENAVQVAHKLGYERPRVALLAALETVNPDMPETVDAAVLSKMCQRGQIKGAVVDGPFALDNAVSPDAARHKGIEGEVAGNADILVVPNLMVGNSLSKSIVFFAERKMAALVVGTSKPVVMTSRTETVENKLLSIALSVYIAGC